LDPRFVGLNPARVDGFLRAINICSTNSLGREVKRGIPYVFMARKTLSLVIRGK
jgi:hypothetical protein